MTDSVKIQFPVEYPIKVVGLNKGLLNLIRPVFEKHAGKLPDEAFAIKQSKESKYESITVTYMAESAEQVQAIFDDLKALDEVIMVL